MRIGELANATGTSVETIRHYEREGLLAAPARSNGNYRLYRAAHRDCLTFIRHCRLLDMSLEEVRALLRFRDAPEQNCAGVNTLLDDHIEHVAQRIEELQVLDQQLRTLRALCRKAEAAHKCGIPGELARVPGGAQPASKVHVSGSHRRVVSTNPAR